MDSKVKDHKLFSKLFMATILIIIFFLILIGIFTLSYQRVYQNAFFIFFNLLLLGFVFIMFGITMIFVSKPHKKTYPLFINWMKASFKIFYPFLYFTGKVIGIQKDRIRGIYAQINNYLISKQNIKVSADEILLLTPHCIQWAQCPHKITNNIKNCTQCGKCQVKDLIQLSEKYGTQLSIVTGGTLARRTVGKKKPKAIVAVACERDLSSGIQDVKVIPILGVVNERPEGPCYNTRVDMSKVEEAILYFLNGGEK